MGCGYMFVCWFGVDVDVIIKLGVWCDLICENLSIGCRILRDSFMSPHIPLS